MDTSLKEMVETLSPMLFARKQLPVDSASFGCQTHDGSVDMVECWPRKKQIPKSSGASHCRIKHKLHMEKISN